MPELTWTSDDNKPRITVQSYKDIILGIINGSSGIKSIALGLKVMEQVNPVSMEPEKFHIALDELVSLGKIIRLEYVLPNDSWTKTIYFPAGTVIK